MYLTTIGFICKMTLKTLYPGGKPKELSFPFKTAVISLDDFNKHLYSSELELFAECGFNPPAVPTTFSIEENATILNYTNSLLYYLKDGSIIQIIQYSYF
jgi:hypothetical protein